MIFNRRVVVQLCDELNKTYKSINDKIHFDYETMDIFLKRYIKVMEELK